MKRTYLTFAALAGATFAAPAPAPVAVATPAPVAVETPAPVYAPAPVVTTTSGPAAPNSPATNAMIQRNIALSGGIDAMGYVPHKYAGKSFATFQWAQGTPAGANTEAWAAFDTWGANFRLNSGAGDLAGYYLTPDLGLGAVVSFRKKSTVLDTTFDQGTLHIHAVDSEDSTFAPDGFELLASIPLGDMHVYANTRLRTLGSWSTDSKADVTGPGVDTSLTASNSSTNFTTGFTVGARTYAGANGSAWQAALSYDLDHRRPSGEDEATYTHRFRLNGRWGQRKDIDGYAIAYGINPDFNYVDSKRAPDVRASLVLPPNLAIDIPLFPSWMLRGGATLPVAFNYDDATAGDNENRSWTLNTTAPTGNLGLRYARSRWAAEAGVGNDFLASGPWFMTGKSTAGNPLLNFALVVNLD